MTFEILLCLSILLVTIILFVTEVLRIDVVALIVMVTLPWMKLITPQEAFSGLSSNAVISIIGVMILSYGIDKSGVMNFLTGPIIKVAGNSENRLTVIMSSAVGVLSAFIQNIGATALFLPAILKITQRMNFSPSRILMPVGFSAILGGTLTLFGSGPLIILNGLLKKNGVTTYRIFDVTPIGLTLLIAGLIYFLFLGGYLLPQGKKTSKESDPSPLTENYHLPTEFHIAKITDQSQIINLKLDNINLWNKFGLHLVVVEENENIMYTPWRQFLFQEGQKLVFCGPKGGFNRFTDQFSLTPLRLADEKFISNKIADCGLAEIIIPPYSPLKGQSLRSFSFRKKLGIEPMLLHNSADGITTSDFSDIKLMPGNILVVHGQWEKIWDLKKSKELIPISKLQETKTDKLRPIPALISFFAAITLALFGFQLSLSLMTGAVAMILFNVISIAEAYKAINWKIVFLLAGLIPLGIAMENSGAASFLADLIFTLLGDAHPLIILTSVAMLGTLFTLFMSNIAATVLLVPLVVLVGKMVHISPNALGLLVAVSASNSFILPTHQVNAFLMGPGKYRNKDYMKAGGLMSIIFIMISVILVYCFYI